MTDAAIEPAFRKRVSYQGALLGGFATLATTLLVLGNIGTSDTIDQRVAEDLQASLSQVVPAKLHDNNLLDNRLDLKLENKDVIIYQGIKNHQVTSLAYGISGQGYGGEIKLILGINAKGEILGVRVISHSETPGLGDNIEEKKSDWIYHFNGLSFNNLAEDQWKVKKDGGVFDQFSGATITPRAVVKAIKEGIEMFQQHKLQMLAIEAPPASSKDPIKKTSARTQSASTESEGTAATSSKGESHE